MDLQPPGGDPVIQDNRLHEGIYILRNKKSRTIADLWSPLQEKTLCHGHWRNVSAAIGHQLWLIQRDGLNETYTIKNIEYSKYLEVADGRCENGSKVLPRPRHLAEEARSNQEWMINELESEEYTIKCARTNTFLEIAGGNASNGAEITCSEAAMEMDHQLWILDRVSRTGSEIKAMFESWKPDLASRIMQPHKAQTEYFVLPYEFRQSLWRNTKLSNQPLRPGIFDYNDFVIKAKEAVSSWARDRYAAQVQGVAVLFGIIYGEARKGPKAYNWYLTHDMCSLAFFDAQIGEEYTPAALDRFGFEPTFVTF